MSSNSARPNKQLQPLGPRKSDAGPTAAADTTQNFNRLSVINENDATRKSLGGYRPLGGDEFATARTPQLPVQNYSFLLVVNLQATCDAHTRPQPEPRVFQLRTGTDPAEEFDPLLAMLRKFNLELLGPRHSGIYVCHNIIQVMKALVTEKQCVLYITSP